MSRLSWSKLLKSGVFQSIDEKEKPLCYYFDNTSRFFLKTFFRMHQRKNDGTRLLRWLNRLKMTSFRKNAVFENIILKALDHFEAF